VGNSLLDVIVVGRNAGLYAAAKATETAVPEYLTLEHINKFNAELDSAGVDTGKVSPMLLPHYARKSK
ncbi:MAG: succinate dehydrogenase/fumarate reductase flavoprotein subunit, partial [Ruminococcus sp.]|nr:succinate dehydrogenase/fumarate reductase flavoprotein subunit [Ruminococcus sp.]